MVYTLKMRKKTLTSITYNHVLGVFSLITPLLITLKMSKENAYHLSMNPEGTKRPFYCL